MPGQSLADWVLSLLSLFLELGRVLRWARVGRADWLRGQEVGMATCKHYDEGVRCSRPATIPPGYCELHVPESPSHRVSLKGGGRATRGAQKHASTRRVSGKR